MDAFDLFRKLGAGAKFDVRRFMGDAERFKVVKRANHDGDTSGSLANLDFFGGGKKQVSEKAGNGLENTKGAGSHNIQNLTDLGGENSKGILNNDLTRKRKGGKLKSMKTQKVAVLDSVAENDGILWMSSLEAKLKETGERKPTAQKLERLRQEKINNFRNKHKIYIQGTDIPEPLATFQQLHQEYKLHDRIIKNVQEAGFQVPTPIQMQAMPIMLHGREILACAPTGSGKTLAFCIPILTHLKQPMNKGFRALIVSPTRELASQINLKIYQNLRREQKKKRTLNEITGGAGEDTNWCLRCRCLLLQVLEELTHRELVKLSEGIGFRIHMIHKAAEASKKFGLKSSKRFDILVTTPNRLVYLLNQEPPGIDLARVEWLVVDESDKLFEEGKSGFRDQLASIFLACTSHNVKRAMFSATFAHDVEHWCKLHLDNVISVSIGARNSAVETVEQQLLFVGAETGKLLAMRDLIKEGFTPPVLVFVQSIERAKELFHELIYEGINVDVIHADRTQQQRDNVIQSFRAGKIWVLICTALLARGIDFKGVNMVINYDFPTSAVEYIHRIGRTGRAGHRGKAVSFFTEDDKPLLRSIANVIQQAGCPVPDYIKHFRKLQSKQKKRLVKNPLKRQKIRTTPEYFLEKAQRKKKIIQKNLKEKKKAIENSNTNNKDHVESTIKNKGAADG